MAKKLVPIRYTSRDFASIKEDLVEHAKRYYPDTFKDFNEASFGSLMLDTVAYVGDVLSFYVDYQANESFLDTSVEYDNVVRLARQMGYRFKGAPSSFGTATFYIIVPSDVVGGIQDKYAPTLLQGSEFATGAGNVFTLVESVDFGNPNNEIVVAKVNADVGTPTHYAIKAFGQVVSGQLARTEVSVGEFQRFLRLEVPVNNISEIISVFDGSGNEYFEVDYLSQDVIYKEIINANVDKADVKSLLRPTVVPRRFVVEQSRGRVFLQFGYGSDSELTTESIAEPSNVALDIHGKNYVSDETFDPSKLLKTDKFGVVPSNTTLIITYRSNVGDTINAPVDTLTEVVMPRFEFENPSNLTPALKDEVIETLEVTNDSPITGDSSYPAIEEIKHRAMGAFAAQNRAVTKQDYKSMVYAMPSQFGSVKRCNIFRDNATLKRNLNLYVLSEDKQGNLARTNATIKQNLKIWINKNKMIHDTIDILDAKIVNIGINFTIVADSERNKFTVLNNATNAVKVEVLRHMDIAEPFYISKIYSVLNKTSGVTDTVSVEIYQKRGQQYSGVTMDIDAQTSADGRAISVPENAVLEVKFPDLDIKGAVK
jgi:hypothetical protein